MSLDVSDRLVHAVVVVAADGRVRPAGGWSPQDPEQHEYQRERHDHYQHEYVRHGRSEDKSARRSGRFRSSVGRRVRRSSSATGRLLRADRRLWLSLAD